MCNTWHESKLFGMVALLVEDGAKACDILGL